MSIPVATLLLRASIVLNDEEYIRWTKDELIQWINEGAVAVIHQRPNAHSSTSNFTLAAGTKQTLPSTISMLLEVIRNMGDGSTPGRIITRTSMSSLDNSNPDWHTKTASANTRHYVYEPENDKLAFYVYPAAVAGKIIEIITSTFPAEVVATNDSLDMPYEYLDSILNYMLFRAFSKDSEFANAQMAIAHFSAFQTSLGISTQAVKPKRPTDE